MELSANGNLSIFTGVGSLLATEAFDALSVLGAKAVIVFPPSKMHVLTCAISVQTQTVNLKLIQYLKN